MGNDQKIPGASLSRRNMLRMMATATGAALLAACGTSASSPDAGDAAGSEPIELTYMTPDRELGQKVDQLAIASFNERMKKEGKPWSVKGVPGPATDNDYNTKINVNAGAGTLPDIVSLGASVVADLAAGGALADLSGYISKWDNYTHIYPVLKEANLINGKNYTTPGGASTFTFFYRKDVLAKNNIKDVQPNTWDDFYGMCDNIAKTGVSAVCLPAATAWGGGSWEEGFRQVWMSFNGEIYSESESKWVVSSPGLLKALTVYQTLAKNKWLTVDALLNPNPWEPTKYQMFPKGDLAVVTGGDWQWTFDWGPTGATPIDGLFEKVGRWQFPSEDGKPFVFVGTGGGPAISAKTKNLDAAWAFLEHLSRPDVVCEANKIYLGGPSGMDNFAELCADYKTQVGGKMLEATSFFNTGKILRNRVGESKIVDGICRATEDVITLKSTPEEAMAAFAAAMKDSLGEDKIKQA
jgi:multiple sugar transport system substrate-binding protein